MLWDTPVCFLGAAYLLLLILVLLQPPSGEGYINALRGLHHRGPAVTPVTSAAAAGGRGRGGAPWRWGLLWALGCLAAADALAQYGLVVASDLGLLPASLADALRRAAGLDAAARGGALWLALLRPAALLAAARAYAGLFALGASLALCRRARAAAGGGAGAPASAGAARPDLVRQASAAWLIRRWLVLHSGKLIFGACLAAAMQLPSAAGAALVAASALLAPARRAAIAPWPAAGARRRERARAGSGSACAGPAPVVLLQVFASAWLIACYTVQVPAVRDWILSDCGPLAPWALAWAGAPVLGGPGDAAAGLLPLAAGGAGVEALLRWKALLLAAAALWQRARRCGQLD